MSSLSTDYSDAQFERKPAGTILLDGHEVAHTLRCVHGGEHFVSVRGSGHKRGYCLKCGGVTCGDPRHAECRHWMKAIEEMERKATFESRYQRG